MVLKALHASTPRRTVDLPSRAGMQWEAAAGCCCSSWWCWLRGRDATGAGGAAASVDTGLAKTSAGVSLAAYLHVPRRKTSRPDSRNDDGAQWSQRKKAVGERGAPGCSTRPFSSLLDDGIFGFVRRLWPGNSQLEGERARVRGRNGQDWGTISRQDVPSPNPPSPSVRPVRPVVQGTGRPEVSPNRAPAASSSQSPQCAPAGPSGPQVPSVARLPPRVPTVFTQRIHPTSVGELPRGPGLVVLPSHRLS